MMSALIGQPPANQNDYWIVLGIMRKIGLENLDPAKGILLPPPRPINDHYRSRGPGIIAANSVCIFLIIFFTGSRLFIRGLYRSLQWGWDDWIISVAMLCTLIWFSASIIGVVYGGRGKHIWDLTYDQYNTYVKISYVNRVTYFPAAILIKMSIACFNRRITGLASKTWRWINDGLFVVLACYMISYSVWLAARCRIANLTLVQLGKAHNPKKCNVNQDIRISIAMSVIQVALGFCLLLTPIIVLWKIKMSRAKKYPLFGIMVIGSVSLIAEVMLVVANYQVIKQDSPWQLSLQNWITLDLLFGIITASLPVLYGQIPKTWALFRTYQRSHGLSQSKSNHREATNGHSELKSGRKGGANGLYTHEDVESQGNAFRVDDQVELLEQPCRRPAEALINGHHAGRERELDNEFSKQASCNVSMESATTPPLPKH